MDGWLPLLHPPLNVDHVGLGFSGFVPRRHANRNLYFKNMHTHTHIYSTYINSAHKCIFIYIYIIYIYTHEA